MSSIFHLANRELTSHPLEFMEMLLSDDQRDLSFSEMIFGTRENVKDAIANECEDNSFYLKIIILRDLFSVEQSKQLNQKNYCDLIFHQLSDTLKSDILDHIAKKTLTSGHVAVAPSVSFE